MSKPPSSSPEGSALDSMPSSASNWSQGSTRSTRKASYDTVRTRSRSTGERGGQTPRWSVAKPKRDLAFTLKSLNHDIYSLPLPRKPACQEIDRHGVWNRLWTLVSLIGLEPADESSTRRSKVAFHLISLFPVTKSVSLCFLVHSGADI
jgi:hypothetical protein